MPTGPALPRLGFGAAPIGDLYEAVDERVALGAVRRALELGISFFDTAPHYGAGLSERRLGVALAGVPREEVVLASKVGRRIVGLGERHGMADIGTHTEHDLSYDGVFRSLEGSLGRLGTDRLDLLYLHDPPDVDESLRGAWRAMRDLRADGSVAAIGVGTADVGFLRRFIGEADPDVVMVAGRLTLLDRTAAAELLPLARERNVRVVAAGVYNSGILASPDSRARFDYRQASADTLTRARELQAMCERRGVPLLAAAAQLPFRHAGVETIVIGMRTAAEVDAGLAATELPIPPELWTELSTVPVPEAG